MIRSAPGTLTSIRDRRSSMPFSECFAHCIGDVAVELVEAEFGVDLVDGPLPERGHFVGDLLVAGEQRPADRVEVVRKQVDALA